MGGGAAGDPPTIAVDDFWLAMAPLLLLHVAQIPKSTALLLSGAPLPLALRAAMHRLGIDAMRWLQQPPPVPYQTKERDVDRGRRRRRRHQNASSDGGGGALSGASLTYGEEVFTFFGPPTPRQQRDLALSQAWRIVKALRASPAFGGQAGQSSSPGRIHENIENVYDTERIR